MQIANTQVGTQFQNFVESHTTGDGVDADEVDLVAEVATVVI